MITISFELCGFSRKKGFLFGDPQRAPITIYRCGIFVLVRFTNMEPPTAFSDFLKANVSLDEYLAEHRPQVRQRIRRAVAKAKRQARAEVADELENYRLAEVEAFRKLQQAAYDRNEFEVTIRRLAKMVPQEDENPL